MMAYHFKIKPTDVDKMELTLIESMLYQLQLWKKKEHEAMNPNG